MAAFERAKAAGYDVEPNGFSEGGWIARNPEGDEIASGCTSERAAWRACDNHRIAMAPDPCEHNGGDDGD